jgi:NADH:ubiquinone oxidoreductase subunit F (NADH-binding)
MTPGNIDHAIANGAYEGLAKALEMAPHETIDEIVRSGAEEVEAGRAFPTGRKWQAAGMFNSPVTHVICNGDEGDPGAFMDRSIMEVIPTRLSKVSSSLVTLSAQN